MARVWALIAVEVPLVDSEGSAGLADVLAVRPLLRPVVIVPTLPGGSGGPAAEPSIAPGGSGCSFLGTIIGL